MNNQLKKASTEGTERVQALARMIATEVPGLDELSDEQLQHLVSFDGMRLQESKGNAELM